MAYPNQQVSALLGMLRQGGGATGGISNPQSNAAGIAGNGYPMAIPAFATSAPATPGQLRGFNADSAAYAEQQRLEAEDAANFARMNASRGGVPAAAPVAAQAQGGGSLMDALNRVNGALAPR